MAAEDKDSICKRCANLCIEFDERIPTLRDEGKNTVWGVGDNQKAGTQIESMHLGTGVQTPGPPGAQLQPLSPSSRGSFMTSDTGSAQDAAPPGPAGPPALCRRRGASSIVSSHNCGPNLFTKEPYALIRARTGLWGRGEGKPPPSTRTTPSRPVG